MITSIFFILIPFCRILKSLPGHHSTGHNPLSGGIYRIMPPLKA
jgi:hypothetical protein